jgi:3-oxocholest-4-en-26-oate---CoA ligase
MEWSLAAVHDVVSAAVPDREMVVWGERRLTHGEGARRTRRFGAFLEAQGLGLERERGDLARWECGQAPVALLLHNGPEYLESMLACWRARAVPFNVNQHYTAGEVEQLLVMVGARAVIYHRSLGHLLEGVVGRLAPLLVAVEDGADAPALAGAVDYEHAVASAPRDEPTAVSSPDDLYMVCTGGTTGRPKAVLWRQGDAYVAAMGGRPDITADDITAAAQAGHDRWFAAPPLMHAAAQWTAFNALHAGGTVVLHDDRHRFDARAILEVAARERATLVAMVGDAYARPIIAELRRTSYDLSALQRIATGGAATSEQAKQDLLELLPHVVVVDGYGASETGGMAYRATTHGPTPTSDSFAPGAGASVLAADRRRFAQPGDGETGWLARRGPVPLGYLGDRERSEATFPEIDGERVAVPGDRAVLEADGTIRMLGRDSLVVNTGGEKVFVEEVEDVLRRHPEIVDALVVGRPSERFGQEVVAVVQRSPGSLLTPAAVRDFATTSLARFKAPRAVVFCDAIRRQPSGKADYRWAAAESARAVDAVGTVATT